MARRPSRQAMGSSATLPQRTEESVVTQVARDRRNGPMERMHVSAREGWKAEVCKYLPESTYWGEGICYRFTEAQIAELNVATAELQSMTMSAVNYAVHNPTVFTQFRIPENYAEMVRQSWLRKDPTVYGRFDLLYDGKNPPKLIEYNSRSSDAALIGRGSSVPSWSNLAGTKSATNRPPARALPAVLRS